MGIIDPPALIRSANLADLSSAAAARLNLAAAGLQSYGLPIGRGSCVVPIGLRGHSQIEDEVSAVSSGTSTTQTYRQFWPLSDPKAGSVLPVFANLNYVGSSGSAGGDADAPNPVTVACSVECSDGTILPFTFGGQHTITIPATDGFLAIPDNPVSFDAQLTVTGSNGISTFTGVWLRVYVSIGASRTDTVTVTNGSATVADASILASDLGRPVSGTGIPASTFVGAPLTASTSFTLVQNTSRTTQSSVNATGNGSSATLTSQSPINWGTFLQFNDKSNGANGADKTPQGSGAFSGSAGAQFSPVALLGPVPSGRKPIVCLISDSIFNGTNDNYIGPVMRGCLSLGYPFVRLSKHGDFAQVFASPAGRRYRQQLAPGCTHAIVQLGTNDGIPDSGSVTSLEGWITTIGQWLSGLGIQPWLTTLPPKTTSTDSWATTGNQTPVFPAAQLASYNGWVRGVPSPYAGYIELGNLCSSAQDSGLWKADGSAFTYTTEGIHPSQALQTGTIAAAVLSTMSGWTVT